MTETPETPEKPFEEQLKSSLSHAYDIERELGGGGMSRVFVATDRLLGRKIVIKLLSPELIESVNRARFRREIQVAAQLQHPHIVTLLSAGEDGNLVYYTMPFIEGESLKSAVEQKGPLGVKEVIRVLYDVTDALSYAHARGVVHRDIKPANILRSGAHSLVTDFGVAKALNAAMSSSPMTSTGMAIGTPAYMAPEQLAGDPTADHRIDIYAVGLLAYELLAGKSPFWAATPMAQMAALLTLNPKPLNEIRSDVPKKLSSVIMSCLEKDPNDRPPTAEALMHLLDGIATMSGEIRTREHKVPTDEHKVRAKTQKVRTREEKERAKGRTAPVPVPVPFFVEGEGEERPPEKSRRGLLIGALAVLLLAATGAGAMLFSRNAKKSEAASADGQKSALAAGQTAATSGAGAAGVGAPGTAASGVAANAPAAPPVFTRVDSLAIAEAVKKALAQAAAAAPKGAGKTTINTDSLRQVAQRRATDSIAAVKVAAAAAVAAAAPVAAPAAAPVTPVARVPGKQRLAIADARVSTDQPEFNSFSRALVDALRSALGGKEAFALVDQDEVRGVLGRTSSRDEATGILQPDAMVTFGFAGTGETVTINVTVRDLRSGSTYGMRAISAKVMPAYPQYYLDPIVQAVVKRLDELSRAPTIGKR
ncbi:MAG TPA: serine/threonine-protein kinase [Gemmatimonadaceae bacterium]|nr:serine/threonine-protein kinase [Gemmatimonadaceae bacterium]